MMFNSRNQAINFSPGFLDTAGFMLRLIPLWRSNFAADAEPERRIPIALLQTRKEAKGEN
jgi:hypothetical protein